MKPNQFQDQIVGELIKAEEQRQLLGLELIASENYISPEVSLALGSVFTNKYAEGYPGARYYGGQAWVDKLERLTQERALAVFGLNPDEWEVNVQALSGTPANLAVYAGLAPIGSTLMGMALPAGGHLSHGHKVSFTAKAWNFVQYGVRPEDSLIDFEALQELAIQAKPKIIVSGSTAYPRQFDFARFGKIAKEVGAFHMADISHIAGLVAAGLHPSPFPDADVVTTTTHKTLRGPRGALIFMRKELAGAINKAVFPGLQGGPHLNTIAGIAVALGEALKPQFKVYQQTIVDNLQSLIRGMGDLQLVSGGSENHLALLDLRDMGITGAVLSQSLEAINITVNKNSIPFDPLPPKESSGIRLGTAALSTRGMGEAEMLQIGSWIRTVAKEQPDAAKLNQLKQAVEELASQYPLFDPKWVLD